MLTFRRPEPGLWVCRLGEAERREDGDSPAAVAASCDRKLDVAAGDERRLWPVETAGAEARTMGRGAVVNRAKITEKPAGLLKRLERQHGPLLFHQSGGCCDGSAPMCFPIDEFLVGPKDVRRGAIGGCGFFIGAAQFDHWEHTKLVIDVVPGRGAGFSVEAPEGVRFLTRSCVFAEAELAELAADGPPQRAGCAATHCAAEEAPP